MEPKRPKLTPEEKYVQKECQDAEIAALKQKLVDMETKLMRVTAELEQVKNERAYDKMNFETEKCELESEIDKYKEQCSELQREIEKFQTEKEKLQSENEKLQNENENLQSENEKLRRYLQDLESSNIKSQINLFNTNLNSQTTKIDEINEDASCMNALPNEIIQKIFSYLTQNQLGQIARVCRKWSLLTKSPVLWRKINVEIYRSSDSENDAKSFNSFIDGLPSCVTFIRLHFSGCAGLDWTLDFEKLCMKLHHRCPNVEALILEACDTLTSLPAVINSCTQYLQGLKKLVFRTCRFKVYSGIAELKDDSNIKVLDLNCSVFSPSSNIQFSKLPSLKELRLASTYACNAGFVGDASFWNQLHVLDLRGTFVTASTFTSILGHGQNLKDLYLCSLRLRDPDFSFNGPVFPHLQTICLSDTFVQCEGLVSLVRSCPSLVSVYVDEDVARSFTEHPFVIANRCKADIVKSITIRHDHNVDYSPH